MEFKFTIDTFDFDGTHKAHKVVAHAVKDSVVALFKQLDQIDGFKDITSMNGVRIEMDLRIYGPNNTKEENIIYNGKVNLHFDVLAADKIIVKVKGKGYVLPDGLTPTEVSYFKPMIERTAYKIIADERKISIETVKTHIGKARSKSGCKTIPEYKAYVKKHQLPH